MMRVLVSGDRNWSDYPFIKEALVHLSETEGPITLVTHGAQRGADSLAGLAAKELNIPCWAFPAHWKKYGRSAGPIRNAQMLKEGKPDQILAFHDNIEVSKGTKNMIKIASKAGIPVTLNKH